MVFLLILPILILEQEKLSLIILTSLLLQLYSLMMKMIMVQTFSLI